MPSLEGLAPVALTLADLCHRQCKGPTAFCCMLQPSAPDWGYYHRHISTTDKKQVRSYFSSAYERILRCDTFTFQIRQQQ